MSRSKRASAGVILFRRMAGPLEVFLVHPGGPFWSRKEEGCWSIPKGEFEQGEDALEAAKREFFEETGHHASGTFRALKALRQPGGKIVHAWAVEGDVDAANIKSNLFSMEWPPRSGKQKQFPEVDRAGWFTIREAYPKLLPGQHDFLEQLEQIVGLPEG